MTDQDNKTPEKTWATPGWTPETKSVKVWKQDWQIRKKHGQH